MSRFRSSIVGILVSALLLAVPTGGVAQVKIENEEIPLLLLQSLGILPLDMKLDIRGENGMQRGDFARILWYMTGGETLKERKTVFPDVNSAEPNSGYIQAMYEKGVFHGNENGLFLPSDYVKWGEATTALMRLLGYAPMAEDNSYVQIGRRVGLFDGIDQPEEDKVVTAGTVVAMVYNGLFIPLMEKNYGTDSYQRKEDVNILSQYFGLYRGKGIVTANEDTGLASAELAVAEGMVQIGEKVYYAGASSAQVYLGREISFLYHPEENGQYDTVSFILKEEGRTENFSAKDIIKFSDFTYFVREEKDRKDKKYRLAVNCDLIYNGKSVDSTLGDDSFFPGEGRVTLIDCHEDGIYETVMVEAFQTIQVEAVDYDAQVLYAKEGAGYNIHLDMNPEKCLVTDNQGKVLSLSEIQPNNIVSSALSKDGSLAHLLVSKETVEGKIEKVYANDEKIVAVIHETEYEVSPIMPEEDAKRIKVGENRKFYLDSFGCIYASGAVEEEAYHLGYLLNAAVTGSLEKQLNLKVLTLENEIRELVTAKRFRLDKQSYSGRAQEAYTVLHSAGVVRRTPVYYRLDSNGNIVELDLPYTDKPEKNESADSLHIYCDTGEKVVYKSGLKSLHAKILLTQNTVVFVEPPDAEDEEGYFVTNYSYFKNDLSYQAKAYCRNVDYDYADVVTVAGNGKEIDWASGVYLISEVMETVGEDGEAITKISAYLGKEKKEFAIKDENSLREITIQPGDLFLLHFDAKNRVDGAEQIYDESTDRYYTDKVIDPGTFGTRHRMLFVRPFDKNGNIIKFLTSGIEPLQMMENVEIYDISKYSPVVFDRKRKEAHLATGAEEILTLKNDSARASKVHLYTTWSNPISMYIYND